jgi:AraC-like DNA-binding protein
MIIHNLPNEYDGHGERSAIQKEIDKVEDFQTIAEVFRQLGDPTRVRIFWILCHCEECVAGIAGMLSMSSPAVSHHLRPLRDNGLIISRRDGKEVYYRAADTEEAKLLHTMIERVMLIACPINSEEEAKLDSSANLPTVYRAEQEKTVRAIHDYLMEHLDQRITTSELAREYFINPTTLKTIFKSIYGTSIAAHMKKHRMERAAEYLRETDRSIADIAQAVGYDSQSRFGEAFKEYYGILPREYRQKQGKKY